MTSEQNETSKSEKETRRCDMCEIKTPSIGLFECQSNVSESCTPQSRYCGDCWVFVPRLRQNMCCYCIDEYQYTVFLDGKGFHIFNLGFDPE